MRSASAGEAPGRSLRGEGRGRPCWADCGGQMEAEPLDELGAFQVPQKAKSAWRKASSLSKLCTQSRFSQDYRYRKIRRGSV